MIKIILFMSLICSTFALKASTTEGKSICGTDDRVASNDPRVGRLSKSREGQGGCTMTLISDSCGVTARHCRPYTKIVEFNTKDSLPTAEVQRSEPEDIYDIDQNFFPPNTKTGRDWRVFMVLPNRVTGKLPGTVQGSYKVDLNYIPKKGDVVRIIGYGSDWDRPTRHVTQQTSVGAVEGINNDNTFIHSVDSRGGNSGSAMILEDSQKIIGINVAGGCISSRKRREHNLATMIYGNINLVNAIKACLAREALLKSQ